MHWVALVSHKCTPGADGVRCTWATSALGSALASALAREQIETLVDPFGPGEHLPSHIQSLAFEGLIFVATEGSLTSHWCVQERAAARERHVPIVAIKVDGAPLPADLPDVLVPAVSQSVDTRVHDQLAELAQRVQRSALVWGALRSLKLCEAAADQRDAAGVVNEKVHEDNASRSALIAQLAFAEQVWQVPLDEVARAEFARALIRLDTPLAMQIVQSPHP